MKSEIDRLTQAPGILAASQTAITRPPVFAGTSDAEGHEDTLLVVAEGDAARDAARWGRLLKAARLVLAVSETDEVKITLDRHTVVVVRSGDILIGVVVMKPHRVVKSLKRMIRRTFKRIGSAAPDTPRRDPILGTPVSAPPPKPPERLF